MYLSKENPELESANEVILELLLSRDAFPALFKLLQISLTIIVSTAECERSLFLPEMYKKVSAFYNFLAMISELGSAFNREGTFTGKMK